MSKDLWPHRDCLLVSSVGRLNLKKKEAFENFLNVTHPVLFVLDHPNPSVETRRHISLGSCSNSPRLQGWPRSRLKPDVTGRLHWQLIWRFSGHNLQSCSRLVLLPGYFSPPLAALLVVTGGFFGAGWAPVDTHRFGYDRDMLSREPSYRT
jgi:hypothetical protein